MKIFPAIDLFKGRAVRLLHGDYNRMTTYSEKPAEVAQSFSEAGAEYIHIVDLEGARDGKTPNFGTVREIIAKSGLFAEVGGGIRSREVIEKYLQAGAGRVILGTAALADPDFLALAVRDFGERVAVGVDVKDGFVAINGWRQTSKVDYLSFCGQLEEIGVRTVICTDISKDGAMRGANHKLYRELSGLFDMNIIASGGVSTLDDLQSLASLGIYGAIIGRALYTGDIKLSEAIKVSRV